MSVQYKTEDGWKNISTSSNNAVDTVADGNMNPVTSNAVYDALNTVTSGTIQEDSDVNVKYDRLGKIVIITILANHALESSVSVTLPFTVIKKAGYKTPLTWDGSFRGEAYLNSSTTLVVDITTGTCSGQIVCFVS